MNLCFISSQQGNSPSGVVTVLLSLCKNWSKNDNIIILTNQSHWLADDFKKLLSNNNISVVKTSFLFASEIFENYNFSSSIFYKIILRFVKIISAPIIIIRLASWLNKNKIEGVLSHNGGWPGGELNRLILIAAKIVRIKKNILVIHNTPSVTKYSIKKLIQLRDLFIKWCCSDIITVSNACRQSLLNETIFDKKLKVIYNGIDLSTPKDNKINTYWNKNSVTIGFVGQLDYRKGIHILLESFKYIDNKCEVVLIGDGDDKEYINQLKSLALDSKYPVHFLGYQKKVINIYEWIDIVVLPSIEYESFGMVLLEAMLWKKPTICSNFGGMKEVVDNGKTGFVVPANNRKELANALSILIRDKDLRNNMGDEGNKRLKNYFSEKIMLNKYQNLFNDNFNL